MPFACVGLVRSHAEEQLVNMIKDITEAVSKNVSTPKEDICVIVNELKKDRYVQGGEWRK